MLYYYNLCVLLVDKTYSIFIADVNVLDRYLEGRADNMVTVTLSQIHVHVHEHVCEHRIHVHVYVHVLLFKLTCTCTCTLLYSYSTPATVHVLYVHVLQE